MTLVLALVLWGVGALGTLALLYAHGEQRLDGDRCPEPGR